MKPVLVNKSYYEKASCQIPMADFIRKMCQQIASQINPEDLHEDGIEDDAHVTVVYGIPEDVIVPNRIDSFMCYLDSEVSYFECEEYDVLKIDVKSKELHKLHDDIVSLNEIKEDYPEYNPHITIAYLKKGVRIDTKVPIRAFWAMNMYVMHNGLVDNIIFREG